MPGIDVIVGGHTHTFMRTPVIVNGTPIVQAGCYGQAVGELVIRMEGRDRKVVSYELLPVDDTIQGDPGLIKEMKAFTAETSRIVFAPRGLRLDEPLAVIDRDWSNTFFDLDASRPLGNVTADAIRYATGADVALNCRRHGPGRFDEGHVRRADGLRHLPDRAARDRRRGPERRRVAGARVSHGTRDQELSGVPAPGQSKHARPILSSRVRHAFPLRPVSTAIRRGDRDRARRSRPRLSRHRHLGHVEGALQRRLQSLPRDHARRDSQEDQRACWQSRQRRRTARRSQSRADALPTEQSGPYLLPPKGTIDKDHVVRDPKAAATMEIKEWQAIMNYLKSLPTKNEKGVTVLTMDERTKENRSINACTTRDEAEPVLAGSRVVSGRSGT